MSRENTVNQIFFQKTTDGDSAIFTASANDLNKQSNNVGIFIYGNFGNATVSLKAKPLKTEQETSPSFTPLNNEENIEINFVSPRLFSLELIDGVDYVLNISGATGSTNISTQIIYDK